MANNSVGVPTARSVGSAFGSAAKGGAGGLVYTLVRRMFGSGLLGSLAAVGLAGGAIKGDEGKIIATMAGFMGGQSLLAGGNNGRSSRGVM